MTGLMSLPNEVLQLIFSFWWSDRSLSNIQDWQLLGEYRFSPRLYNIVERIVCESVRFRFDGPSICVSKWLMQGLYQVPSALQSVRRIHLYYKTTYQNHFPWVILSTLLFCDCAFWLYFEGCSIQEIYSILSLRYKTRTRIVHCSFGRFHRFLPHDLPHLRQRVKPEDFEFALYRFPFTFADFTYTLNYLDQFPCTSVTLHLDWLPLYGGRHRTMHQRYEAIKKLELRNFGHRWLSAAAFVAMFPNLTHFSITRFHALQSRDYRSLVAALPRTLCAFSVRYTDFPIEHLEPLKDFRHLETLTMYLIARPTKEETDADWPPLAEILAVLPIKYLTIMVGKWSSSYMQYSADDRLLSIIARLPQLRTISFVMVSDRHPSRFDDPLFMTEELCRSRGISFESKAEYN